MAELYISTIARRSIQGLVFLTSSQIVSNALIFLLTILIDPKTFGVFIVVSASLSFFTYFSDIGLAAALVQKKEKVTEEDLMTTFTIQQSLVMTLLIVGFVLTPFVASFYKLDKEGVQLFQALIFSLFLSSLKTIPSILLERNLQFGKLVIPQVIENLVFNIIAVVLTAAGLGITSFTFAVLARGIVGLISIYIVSPWPIRIGISKNSAKKLLSYGIPFQLNSILALIKDDLLIIALGKILTFTEIGYVGFAQKWAFVPLRLIMDKLIRVLFPAFSRLQEDGTYLKLAIERSIFSIAFFTIPSLVGLVILAPYGISIVPKYNKWEAALPLISFFAINALLSSFSTPLTNMLNAIGKIKVTLRLMVFWTIATWVLTFSLVRVMGFLGVAVASAVVSLSVVYVIYLVRRYADFDIAKPVGLPLLSAIFMGIVLYFTAQLLVKDIVTFIASIVLGVVIYLATMFIIARGEMQANIYSIFQHFRHPRP